MQKVACLVGAFGLVAAVSGGVVAGPQKETFIDKVILAYGGERLTGLNSLVLEDRYKSVTVDGGPVPGEADISRLNSTLTVDFLGGRKAVKNWRMSKAGNRLGKIMFDGKQGWSVNFLRGSYVERDDLTGKNVGAGMMRLLDTTMVRELNMQRTNSTLGDQQDINGKAHAVIEVKPEGAAAYSLFIDLETHMVTKLRRGRATYYYADHRLKDGIRYAADTNYMVDGQPRLMTLSRTISVNQDVEPAFGIPADAKKLKGMMDNSKMSVRQLSEHSYMVGKGFAFSLFVDAGDHFVAAGGLPGTKARLEALNAALGTDKPLRYVVLPEHQGSHLGGIDEIADLGATFVVHQSHVEALKDKLSKSLAEDRIFAVDKGSDFAESQVQLFDIPTIQSAHYLLMYVPEAKLVFSVDEFGTNLRDSVPSADKRMVSFRKALAALPVEISRIVHIHGRQVLTVEQLVEVTSGYRDAVCPEGEAICAD